MRRQRITLFLLLLLAALILHHEGIGSPFSIGDGGTPSSTIEYRGHAIKLSRPYDTYEDYKDDPNNIDPSENKLVEQLVSEAPVPASYPDVNAISHDEIFNLKFPGYGCESYGTMPDASLYMESIEIPRAGTERYLVFRHIENRYVLVDDFIANDKDDISTVRDESGHLAYYTRAGTFWTRPTPRSVNTPR
jgi:hypothetical protein